jgi:hypothetical protein
MDCWTSVPMQESSGNDHWMEDEELIRIHVRIGEGEEAEEDEVVEEDYLPVTSMAPVAEVRLQAITSDRSVIAEFRQGGPFCPKATVYTCCLQSWSRTTIGQFEEARVYVKLCPSNVNT